MCRLPGNIDCCCPVYSFSNKFTK
ncbi:MAG: hypothetical protein J6Y78_08095 [Paludibacteraceae bacterium]|nr:hypothetical protein [Paludibacteraceae bacterium]